MEPSWLLVLLTYFLFPKETHGIADLDCAVFDNATYVANGANISLVCTTQSQAIRWELPLGSEISFSGSDSPGNMTMKDGFTATYVVKGSVSINSVSSLNFILTASLNGTTVTCEDVGFSGPDNCLILVISTPQIPSDPSINSSTYESVLLQWSPPSFNGGSVITSYIISVTPSPRSDSSCPGGQCDTTGLSFNVTDLDPNVNYQFNISAVNSAGVGENASINVPSLGTVFPALTDPPQLCLNYSDNNGLILLITWNCSSITNATTPSLTSYTVCINNESSMVSTGSCSMTLPVNCSDTYNVTVSINNIVGSSDPSPIASISTDILQSSMAGMTTNESARISYTPFDACSGFTSSNIEIILTNLNTSSMDTTRSVTYNTNGGVITLDSLNASTMYMYSLLLVVNGNDVCDGSQFNNFITFSTDDNGGETPTSTSPTASVTPSPTTTDTPSPSQSPTLTTETTSGSLPLGAIVGIAVVVVIIVLGAVIIIIVICCCLKNRDKSVNFNRGSRDSAAEPIALVDKKDHGSSPATGQPIYQEAMSSEDIQREAAPTTGELYAQPSKGSTRRPPPQPQSELATYQDPSTIQRTQAPNMEYLYAEVDKSKPQQQQAVYAQVDKEKKGGDGTVYADLELKNTQGGPVTGSNPSNVIYSDVHNN